MPRWRAGVIGEAVPADLRGLPGRGAPIAGNNALVGKRTDRWNERLQRSAERANRVHSADPDWEKRNAATPGPPWAHGIGAVPVLHWIGDIAIAIDAWRQRKDVKQ
jgi:hypothetical protein